MNCDKESDEGKFFRAHFPGLENTTFMATASGKRLERGWDSWYALSASERQAGAIKVPNVLEGKKANPDPPPGGLIAQVYIRNFQRTADGRFEYEKLLSQGGGRYESEPGRDHFWLTKDEWHSLLPKELKVGASYAVPLPVRDRIVRYHLLLAPDRVVGRGWERAAMRKAHLMLTVEKVLSEAVHLRLSVSVLLAHPPEKEIAKSLYGYEGGLYGYLTIDRKTGTFSRFDIIAFGQFWDRSNDWRRGRSERGWLAVAFELAQEGKSPESALRVPPYLLLRQENDYFGTKR